MQHNANSFDLVRLSAASAVMLSHSTRAFFGLADPGTYVLGNITLGDAAVYVFFALSGYLICGSLLRGGEGFTRRRAGRILPGLFGCVIFCVIAAGFFVPSLRDYFVSKAIYVFLMNIFIFPLAQSPAHAMCNTAYGCSMVGPFWTLGYEVACYTLLAILFWLFRPQAKFVVAVVIAASVAALAESYLIAPHVVHLEAFGFMIFHMDSRSLSSMVAIFFVGALIRFDRKPVFFDYRIGLVALLLFWIGCRAGPVSAVFAAIPTIPVAVIALGSIPSRLSSFLTDRVGDLSYGVYLYHFPVQVIVWMALFPILGAWGVALAYAATFILAYASFHLIERPVMEAASQTRRRVATSQPA